MSKIRLDFVTNSSSSSYTCCVCRGVASGWDISLEEAEMVECENGHTFCEEHLVGENYNQLLKKCKEMKREKNEEFNENDFDIDFRYGILKESCPICTFNAITIDDLSKYLLKRLEMTVKDVLFEIKRKYCDYEKFNDDIKQVCNKNDDVISRE